MGKFDGLSHIEARLILALESELKRLMELRDEKLHAFEGGTLDYAEIVALNTVQQSLVRIFNRIVED